MLLRALFPCLALAGCMETIEHDEMQAAKRAEDFAAVAIVRNDGERGYELLAPATRRYVTLEQFKHVLLRLHPQGTPRNVKATDYEPMKGEKAVFIYLSGSGSGENFYYRITMEETAGTDYRVLKFERSQEPYAPSTGKKPLNR